MIWLVFSFLWCSFIGAEPLVCEVASNRVIMINAENGNVLFEKGGYESCYPASTLKVATALYAIDQKGETLDTMIVAEQEAIASISPAMKKKNNYKNPSFWLETGATHIGIKRGEILSFKDLLHAVLVASANDASNVVAQYVGEGSIERFIKNLNRYVRTIGCTNTHFCNPHGLHHPEQVTTPYDLALITKKALTVPLFQEIVKTKRYIIEKSNKQPERILVQTNLLIKKSAYTYAPAIGVKTGTTSDAGFNLIAAAKHNDRTLIIVMMHCTEKKELYEDVTKLFETAFKEEKVENIVAEKGLLSLKAPFITGSKELLTAKLQEDLTFTTYPSEEPTVRVKVEWASKLTLPIKQDSVIGSLQLFDQENRLLATSLIVAANDVEPTFWHRLKQFFSKDS